MTRMSKLMIAVAAVIVGIGAGVIWVMLNQQDFISEEEAHALVTERYGGNVSSIETLEDEQYFSVVLEDKQTSHNITLDRSDSSVQDIETLSNTTETSEGDNKDSTAEEDIPEEPRDEDNTTDEAAEDDNTEAQLTLEEAEERAVGEVGGETVYSTASGEGQSAEYYILQLIDGDDEGALVLVNGATGDVSKVIWLEIDDDYEEIERLVQEATEYADLYDQRYIEFDDDYFDD